MYMNDVYKFPDQSKHFTDNDVLLVKIQHTVQ